MKSDSRVTALSQEFVTETAGIEVTPWVAR